MQRPDELDLTGFAESYEEWVDVGKVKDEGDGEGKASTATRGFSGRFRSVLLGELGTT